MESGLLADDRNSPRCYIQVVPAADLAGPFLHWLSGIADVQHSVQSLSGKAERVRTGFQTLRDAIKGLETSFGRNQWPLSDLVMGKFLFILDHYLRVTAGDTEPIFHSSRLSPYHLSTAEMSSKERTGPELSEPDVIRAFAEPILKRLMRRCISQLQRMTSGGLSGDDSVLENLWDEICAQVQYEESFHWEAYDETVRGFVRAELRDLQRHEREAVWLQTPEGFDWLFDDEETCEQYPVCEDDIIDYLVREHIYSRAENWSNKRIRAYLDHDYEID